MFQEGNSILVKNVKQRYLLHLSLSILNTLICEAGRARAPLDISLVAELATLAK